jgi:hypothetical protein
MKTVSRDLFCQVFVASLFFTECIYIYIGNGARRICHFIACDVMIALLHKKAYAVARSRMAAKLLP